MILLYRGTSALSRLIRFVNWGPHSHAAWSDAQTEAEIQHAAVIEAWWPRVRTLPNVHHGHTAGTVVDVYDFPAMTPAQRLGVGCAMRRQLGKAYDIAGVLHFLTRRPEHTASQRRWFCSELVAAALAEVGSPALLRIPAWKVYPSMLAYSPLAREVCSIVV